MRVRRFMAAAAATVLVASGAVLAGASSASAASSDQIWYQSVGSPSKDAPCPESDPADLAKGWTPWVKGYEAWPNDGKGGWTCGRSILWAKGSMPPSGTEGPAFPSNSGCQKYSVYYVDYGVGYSAPQGSPAYSQSNCTSFAGSTASYSVYAPAPYDPDVLCLAAFGTLSSGQWSSAVDVYRCGAF